VTPPRKPLSQVVEACPPSGIRKFFDLAQTMSGVISLGVGEPDFPTPWGVRESAIHALTRGATTYTSNSGLLELRELVCADLAGRCGVTYRPADECLVTSGVSEGLDLALRALINPGDEVIVPEPCYVAYQPCVAFAGGVPVPVAMDPAQGYRLDADRIAAAVTPRTKAVLFGSPSNPTGAAQSADDLTALAALAEREDFWLVSDEIYDRLTYAGHHTSTAAVPGAWDRTVLLGGFSKSYAMTGWRVGYVCAPGSLAALMHRIHQYTMLCAPHVSQVAAVEALRNAEPRRGALPPPRARGHRDGGRLRPPPPAVRQGPRRARPDVPGAGRRLLRVPLDPGQRAVVAGLRRAAAERAEGGRGPRRRLRPLGRGPRALLLRHRAPPARAGPRADRHVPRHPYVMG
jgi:aminotransferase